MRENRGRLEEEGQMNGFGDFLSLGAAGLEDGAFGVALRQKKAAGKRG